MYRFYMPLISRKIYVLDSLRKAQSLNEKKNHLTFTAICLFWLDQFFFLFAFESILAATEQFN